MLSYSVRSDSVTPWTIARRFLCPWASPGKDTGVGCHAFLQGILLTQGSNPCLLCLLHWQAGSLSGSLSLPTLLQEQRIKSHLDFTFLLATGQRALEGEGLGVMNGDSIQFSPPCPYLFGIGSLSFDFDPPSHLS